MRCKTTPGIASQELVCAAVPSVGQINSLISPISSLLQENYVKYHFTEHERGCKQLKSR